MKHVKSATKFYLAAGPALFGAAYALVATFSGSQDGMLGNGVSDYGADVVSALATNAKMFLIFAPFAIIGAYFYTGLIFVAVGAACGFWKRKFGTHPLWLAILAALIMSAASGFALHKVRWFLVWPETFHSLLRFSEASIPLLLAATIGWYVHKQQVKAEA